LDELDIVSKIHWGAEVVIWDQFFTVRPDATLSDGAVSGIIGSNARAPHGVLGVFTNISRVAELSCEQWSLSSRWLSWLNWWSSGGISSLSPLASLVAVSYSDSRDASLDEINVGSEVHWSTELVIWDQFFTIRPVATSSDGARLDVGSGDALFPNGLWSFFGDVDWMAEVLREQWSWSSWLGWLGISSVSPLTSLSTSSSRLS